jgi:MFS transporter, putative metabolite:H+ symporter
VQSNPVFPIEGEPERLPGGIGHNSIAARLDRVPVGPFHLRLASKLGVGTFFDGFDALSIAVVLVTIAQTFGINIAEAGLLVSAGYAGQFVGAIVVGALSDRFGRKKTFTLSLALFGAVSILCALAWSSESLLVFRLIQGIGLGAEVPIAATLLNEYLTSRNRGRVALLYQSTFTWGLFCAPLVALLTVSLAGPELGWRLLFAVGALPLLVAVWAWFSLPESARWLAVQGRNDEADGLTRMIEEEAVRRGAALEEPAVVPDAPTGKVSIGEIWTRYRGRTLMLLSTWFLSYFITYGCAVWLPTLYIKIGGLPTSSSLALTLISTGLIIVSVYVAAALVERVGRRPLFAVSFALMAFGGVFGWVTVGLLGYTSWPWLLTTGLIITAGSGIPSAALYLYTAELYPTGIRGWASSICSSMARLANVVSPILIAWLLQTQGGGAVFAALAIAAVLGVIVIVVAGIETRNRSLEQLSV